MRACDYGTCGVQEYIDTANANTMIVSHCESKTCVENLDEVLKVDGIDVIFIGPMDLSQSYGVPGKITDPEVKAAIDTITAKTLAAGKAVGTTAASAEAAKALIAKACSTSCSPLTKGSSSSGARRPSAGSAAEKERT